jgi:hypothetical protein
MLLSTTYFRLLTGGDFVGTGDLVGTGACLIGDFAGGTTAF